eukprot:symbB.v1.2.011047.t1/scaffold734.1/size167996/6
MHTPYSEALLQWSKTRLIYFAGLTASLGVLLALLARLGCCRPNREHYVSHLFRRSMQQVLIRGAICYSIYVTVPWILLQMQNLSWGTQSVLFKTEKGKEWVHYYCWKYIHESIRNGPSCIDYMQPFHNTLWFNDGHNSLYRNATWLAENHVGLRPTGQDPGGDTQYTTPMFLVVNLIIFAAGLIGLLWGLSLLRWYLTLAGPIWAAFLVALVAQWQIFGPLTGPKGQYLFPNLLHFSEKSSSWIFRVCIIAAVITLPIYDLLIKLIHSYYRRSLQLAYFCDGEDIEFPAAAESPYCPNLLLGACINDFRRPEDKELLSDFTLSPLFMGCPRTGFFRTDRRMRLGYAISVSGAAPDTLMLTKFDVLPIRFLLSVFSLRLGDFVRLAPDGKVAKQMGTAFRRIEERAAPSAAGNEAPDCPGCGLRVADLRRHMKRCCPEKLPERVQAPGDGSRQAARKAASEQDWISEEEVKEAALQSFSRVKDPLLRRVLELRFGADQGGHRRSPAEVAEVLGGKYAGKAETALMLIRQALRSIPLVADDPKDLVVIYEDDDLLAVSKPPFLRVTPVHRFVGKSLTNQVLGYLQGKYGEGYESAMVLHRLDQTTSGLVLCAKNKEAARICGDRWHDDACRKEYLAIALPQGPCELKKIGDTLVVDAPIGLDKTSDDPVRRAINSDGQHAATRFEVIDVGIDGALLLTCILEKSGRTHQIRLHAKHFGAPLLGDEMYGGENVVMHPAAPKRVALHAWHLEAPHPRLEQQLQLKAPVPADLLESLQKLGIDFSQPLR